nr:hypothetical protein GCM10020241_17730 [Streptoalloteichus tenebrarius]
MGELEQLLQPAVGEPQDLQDLLLGQSLAPVEHLLPGDGEDVPGAGFDGGSLSGCGHGSPLSSILSSMRLAL